MGGGVYLGFRNGKKHSLCVCLPLKVQRERD